MLFVTDRSRPYRLTRDLPANFGFFLNPHAWQVLKSCRDEAQHLINEAGGRGLIKRRDLHIAAVSGAGAQALDHVTQLARFYGYESESVPVEQVIKPRASGVVRGVMSFDPARFWLKFFGRINSDKITIADFANMSVGFGTSGGAEIRANEQTFRAKRIALIDSEAISHYCPDDLLSGCFETGQDSVIGLTQRSRQRETLFVPEFNLRQFVSGRFARVIGLRGSLDEALSNAAGLLSDFEPGQINALSTRSSLAVKGGGPLAGRAGAGSPLLIAGFGLTAPFLAPALARLIAESLRPEEERLFEGIRPDPDLQRKVRDLPIPMSRTAEVA
ncbi:MAG: hypothetical protein KDJ19_06250 [Hyphomicrobiaceae bacterium]|nr:hypothetical protein [Hyphomicrobiaceae bacterium]MCC0025294.1 hypothetical protein [Hyphomicrobiaceae bacterium]